MLGAPKVGINKFWEIKMADRDHIAHQRIKFRKQKSSVSLSYSWNVPKFLVSGQTLVSYGQKTIFQEFGPLKQTLGKDNLSMPIFPPSGDFFWQFLDSNLFSMHRREYVPIFIWISCSGECLGRGGVRLRN